MNIVETFLVVVLFVVLAVVGCALIGPVLDSPVPAQAAAIVAPSDFGSPWIDEADLAAGFADLDAGNFTGERAEFAIGSLSNLPMTKHAEEAHANDEWNARNIRGKIDRRECKRIEASLCTIPAVHTKLACSIGNGMWVGLVIGHANPQAPDIIVTGYAYTESYYRGILRRDGCAGAQLK